MITEDIRSVADVRHARETLEFAVNAFLRSAGWKSTSHTPGCFWLWEREIDGRRVLVDKDTALGIQESLDPQDPEEDQCPKA